MKLSEWAVRHVKPVVFVAIALSLAGIFLYRSFPVSILPDVTFPRVVAIADDGDLPVNMVEVSITRPIEEALSTIPDVHRIRSTTKRGSTEIQVDFLPGTDIILAEQIVNAKVNQVRPQIPITTQTEIERMNATIFPVMGLTLKSKSLTPTELWNLATYNLKPRLSRVTDVARVVVQGGRAPEVAVNLRPDALATFGIAPTDVVTAIDGANQVKSVGRLDQRFQRFQVTVDDQLHSLDELREIVVAQRNGGPVRLRQLADVSESKEDRTTIVSANGAESVLLNVIRQPTGNSVAMVDAVQKEITRLKPTLPADVEIGTFYDQSVLIHEAINSVRDAVLIGAGLSVIVLLMFLGDLRATIVTALIIPVTILITFVLMRLAGLTLNLMTLGALAVGIGLVIDDAIVVVEAVFRHDRTSPSMVEAVKAASSQIAGPMISSTITTVVVFLPLAFLAGVSGAFFSALALTLTIALIVSLALALVVSPSLCAAFLKRSDKHGTGRMFGFLLCAYHSLLVFLLKFKWVVVPIIGLTLFGTWFIGTRLDSGFMPEMDEGAFVLDYWTPKGTSLEESDRLLSKVDAILNETPEISTYSRRTGTELGFAITETNRGDYAVMLKPNRHRKIDEVMKEVREKIQSDIPGLDVEFIQVLQDLIGDLAGNPSPIEVKLFGEDREAIEAAANDLVTKLSAVKGIVDVKSGAIESGPEARFIVDKLAAGRMGMTADSIAAQANATLLGTVATQLLRNDRQVPVRVRLPEGSRTDLAQIERIGILTPVGRVQLRDLAKVELVAGTTQLSREDQRRLVAVTGQLEGLDLGTAIKSVREILAKTTFAPGIQPVIAGQFQSQQESFTNLAMVLGVAVILVFTVMLFQFRSFIAPTVILVLMPLSLFGAVVALSITHTALNVSSFMGVIMLAGIVVKNGILLLDRAQNALEEGVSTTDAVLAAGETRLRPILMTTLTAILGLLPLALGLGAGAEMQKPLAVSVIGGLIFSTILTLIVGPLLFCTFVRPKRRAA